MALCWPLYVRNVRNAENALDAKTLLKSSVGWLKQEAHMEVVFLRLGSVVSPMASTANGEEALEWRVCV